MLYSRPERLPLKAGLATLALLVLLLSLPAAARAGDSAVFPPELMFSENGEMHRMAFTGASERVFLFFKVYGIAHYAETGGPASLSLGNLVEDGRSKAILIRFHRKLGLERIRDEFAESIRRNGESQWLVDAEPTIAAFIAAIDRDARAGDQLVFYWLDGGRLIAGFNGEPSFVATDTAFAKLIWSIWFGDDPVCDRQELLAQLDAGGDR